MPDIDKILEQLLSDPRLREWVPTGKGVRARFEGEPEWDGSVM